MFTKTKSYISDLEVLTYKNAHSGNAFSIVPAFGALITSIIIGGQELLDGPDHPETGENPGFKGSLLAPFANRVNHGTYSFQGNTYHLPVNEKANDNALHGFVYKQKFDLVKEIKSQKYVSIELKNSYAGGEQGYPFPFDTHFTIELDDRDGFICTLEFANTGKTDLPLVAGWHPYYSLQSPVDRLMLKLPKGKIIEVDKRMIPAGGMHEYHEFDDWKPVGDRKFDNIFKLGQTNSRQEILLKNTANGIAISAWQEPSLFGYWVIYTPPGRNSMAIEPMSGNIDAFNNGEGLVIIKPGEKVSGKFGVTRID